MTAYKRWAAWREQGGIPPRPKGLPSKIPKAWWSRYLADHPPKPKTSLFSSLGGFVSQAGAFPPDTQSAKAFLASGGKWLAVQWGDTKTEAGNLRRFDEQWDDRWRAQGVKVLGWARTNQIKGREGEYAVDMTDALELDGWVFNPEQPAELARTQASLAEYRLTYPARPLAVITLGKAPGFPTGALEESDAQLILECFLETPQSDTTVANSVPWWLRSGVPLHRLHVCLLHTPTNTRYPDVVAVAEAEALGVVGLSSFTCENTSVTAWQVMG